MLHFLVSLLYPPFCIVCEKSTGRPGRLVCAACRKSALENPVEQTLFGRTPEAGEDRALPVHAGWSWNEAWETLLHKFKYQGYGRLAKLFGSELAAALTARGNAPSAGSVLVPVPVTPVRRRDRGYNQAELLARVLAEHWNVPVDAKRIVRRGRSRSQTKLSAVERKKNVAGVFRARPNGEDGRPVVIVDDVVTTGATLAAAAEALRTAGFDVAGCVAVVCSSRWSSPDPSDTASRNGRVRSVKKRSRTGTGSNRSRAISKR